MRIIYDDMVEGTYKFILSARRKRGIACELFFLLRKVDLLVENVSYKVNDEGEFMVVSMRTGQKYTIDITNLSPLTAAVKVIEYMRDNTNAITDI